jgi:gliding motility-associated-like protein
MKKILPLSAILLFFKVSQLLAQPCVGSQSITATPPPSPLGTYAVGTTVTFCYSVSNYSQSGADWIAGIVPTLGPAWDPTTLQPVSAAASCDGQGNWAWYQSCTGTASGQTWGPGFYYDSPLGSSSGTLDGIPGNNYGDNCQNHTWTFCFSVQVGQCLPSGSSSLYVGVQALSDYSAGSWGTNACQDPPYSYGVINCVNNCALIIQNIIVNNASCANTTDGSITAIPSGAPPYTYQWSNGATTQTINNLPPGIYTLTVTDSLFCTKTVTVPVGSPQPIVSNATVIDNNCTVDNGSIALAPTGGTNAGYTYSWNNGATTSSITNLAGGTYIVTVSDSNNCSVTDTFLISTFIPLTLTTSSTGTTCNTSNGTASVTVSGGAGPYTYDWQPAGGSSATATNLAAGTYTITVTDSNGCTATETVTVTAIGTFTLSTTFVPLQCDPAGTTTATVSVGGGTGPFTYQWLPFGGNAATATGLTSGNYTVVVTDANNCVDSAFVTIPAITALTASTSGTAVQCNQPNSGTATVTASGGTSPYTYLWSEGSTSAGISNLAGGTYTVTVTDANGCTVTETVVINVIPDVFADAGTAQSVCNGDPATLTGSASGGTAPFSYSWSNGVNQASQTVSPGTTTTYTLTVTDANGCTATSNVTVSVTDYPNVTVSPDTDICSGGSTTLSASGGATYSWSPADGLSSTNIPNPVASPASTTTYTVTVSNAQCSSTGTVTVTVADPVVAAFTADTTQGQSPLTVNFTNNSTGSVSYLWNFGDGNSSTDPNPVHTYVQDGNYTVVLIAVNSLGCTDTIRFSFIVVDSESVLIVPNVFTPNNDGFNDTFSFVEENIISVSVNIFNRWGREVYSWNRINGSWDGKSKDGEVLPDGVYVYVIKAKGKEGKSHQYEGTVHLIRNEK